MKKWLSILLMCSMLVGSLAGCGSGGKTAAPIARTLFDTYFAR